MTVISSYFTRNKGINSGEEVYKKGGFLRIGQVNQTYHADHKLNRNKQFVEYEVLIQEEVGAVLYPNAIALQDLGGTNDYSEVILEHSEFSFKGKLEDGNSPVFKNGSRVLVGFIDSNVDRPVILGAISHSRRDFIPLEDGISRFSEFRGIQTSITKEGAFSVTYKGSRKANSEFERPETAPTSINIDATGVFSLEDKENQLFKMDRVAKTIAIEQYTEVKTDDPGGEMLENPPKEQAQDQASSELINSITLDKTAKTIVIKAGADGDKSVTINMDGTGDKIEITTTTGVKLTVDGTSNKIIAKSGLIELGEGAAESVVLGDTFKTEYDAHTHLTAMGPSGTATPPMTVASLSDKVKAKK